MKAFSIREVFKAGWHTLRAHSRLVFAVVLTLFAMQIAQAVVDKSLGGTPMGGMALLVVGIAGAVLGVGATVISLRLAEHKHAEYRDLVPEWRILWRMVLGGIVAGILIVLPLVAAAGYVLVQLVNALGPGTVAALFESLGGSAEAAQAAWEAMYAVFNGTTFMAIAVGALASAYFALRLAFARLAIVDGAGVIESLRRSWHLTRGAVAKLLLFALAAILVNLLGAIPFGLGLLLTIPLTLLALAHAYIKLKHRHHAA